MIRPGLEPGTFCVLDRCDNQLRHRTVLKWRLYLALASMDTSSGTVCDETVGRKGISRRDAE